MLTQLDPTREHACYLAKTTSRQIGRFKILFSLDAKLACHVTNVVPPEFYRPRMKGAEIDTGN